MLEGDINAIALVARASVIGNAVICIENEATLIEVTFHVNVNTIVAIVGKNVVIDIEVNIELARGRRGRRPNLEAVIATACHGVVDNYES